MSEEKLTWQLPIKDWTHEAEVCVTDHGGELYADGGWWAVVPGDESADGEEFVYTFDDGLGVRYNPKTYYLCLEPAKPKQKL